MSEEEEDRPRQREIDLLLLEQDAAGERAHTRRTARFGLPAMRESAKFGEGKRRASQYRACLAMGWDDERILAETNFTEAQLRTARKAVADEDERDATEMEATGVYAQYRRRQELCVKELEDLALVFRKNGQFNALVAAVRARSEILDKILKTGQEMGFVRRKPKEIRVDVNVENMQLDELREEITRQIEGVQQLIEGPGRADSATSSTVLRQIRRRNGLIEAEARPKLPAPESEPSKAKRRPRVRKLAKSAA